MPLLTDTQEARTRTRQRLIDALVKVLPLLVLMVFSYSGGARSFSEIGLEVPWYAGILLEILCILPLAFSRTNPGAAAGFMAVCCAGQLVIGAAPSVSALAVPLVVYACAKYGTPRVSWGYLAVALLGAAALGAYFVYLDLHYQQQYQGYGNWTEALAGAGLTGGFAGAVALVFWLAGHLAGRRRRELGAISERNQLLIRERDQEARLAVDAERMRIAREMHDVISHSMSVMIAQADGGRYVLQQNPERAEAAFATISDTGREALTEMRRMLGVLRDEHGELQKRPAPGVQDLPQLIDDVSASGLQVRLHMLSDSIPRLPEGVGLAAYRIVQEALTNTLKHGGPRARAEVWVATAAEPEPALMLEVRDSGLGASAANDGAGSGLLGMAERARLYGGTVTTRAHSGGFDVLARFPLSTAVAASPAGPGAEANPSNHGQENS
ncbi:sensor histidine kinase [Nesterenkonia sp. E16_7]|uniref:sensor histidine kinase n=1 Tax=unclassified Nesterenkonia TaxID=2629769 RepID=UPI001A912746|nr:MULTISPECIES: histidine kinase [unclassified Nesterenkonia]MBO0595498.1 sensor histidine kinase [Nesterenkonia sp. E16_10]MBO0599056.1 sensor histidine kinase [Nesterenkonia sp. E16_7]